jgi:hypothetical protein
VHIFIFFLRYAEVEFGIIMGGFVLIAISTYFSDVYVQHMIAEANIAAIFVHPSFEVFTMYINGAVFYLSVK